MELIIADNLCLHTGSKDLISEGSFRILEGRKYGLIGPNGSGKTSLIRMLLGEIEPDAGRLKIKPKLKIGYVPQQPEYNKDLSIEDFLAAELLVLEAEMNKAAEAMSSGLNEDMDKLLASYQHCSERFDATGGYEALDRVESVIRKLGLNNSMDQKMGSLSGGERSLVFFASAILPGPELLILDEPGNHLDYLGLAWLEAFITGFKESVLIVSHNRYLLDKTCSTILALENGRFMVTNGNYSDYKLTRYRSAIIEQSEYEASRKLVEKLEKKIKELQSIAMSQYNPPASVMSQLSDAKTKLAEEKKRNLERPRLDDDKINFDFGDELSKSDIAIQIKDFELAFGENVLLNRAELDISCGEKVALVGPNGSGKTSLINAVLHNGDWDNRMLRIGPSQRIGYLSQVAAFSTDALTIEDEIRNWGAITRDAAFGIAARFLFEYIDLQKPLAVLSGGEVNRLQLAKLMYSRKNFLVLDEPTNHMDILSREAIEHAVSSYKGTVLVISHDRYFLDRLVDRVIEIDDKRLVSYDGNFSSYFKTKYPVLPRLGGQLKNRGAERRSSGNAAANASEIERRIEEHEKERLELEGEMEAAFGRNDRKAGLKASAKL
ncbi:MAG TPA: hypothetical protein DCO79_07785, partial [Spirochaeta sp.]|nr:hypothetical protein [Spirochaeta sp.]